MPGVTPGRRLAQSHHSPNLPRVLGVAEIKDAREKNYMRNGQNVLKDGGGGKK